MSQVASSSVFQTWNDQQQAPSSCTTNYSHHSAETSEPFSSFPPPSSTSSASSSRIQSPQPSTRYNDHNGPLPLKNRTAHSAAPAYHPYRNNPPSHSSPPKPILFVDATFQPGDSASSTYSGAGLPQCRPKRKRITTEQLTRLLDVFEATDNPCFDVREQVGNEIGMSNREVQVWFQNRRAKVTRERGAVLNKASPPQISTSPVDPTPSATTPVPTTQSHHSRTESLSSGQHQWRFANPHSADHASQRNSMRYSSAQTHQSEAPTSVPHYRKMFGDQRILLPRSSSPLPSPEVLSSASNASSSYFANVTTPPLSYTATTPGAASPNAGHIFGDYARSDTTSPLISLPSPSTAFNRLALRSPGAQYIEREPFFFAAAEMPSPNPSETEEYIHLAPLRGWDPSATPKSLPAFSGSRRRSISNPEHQPLRSPPATTAISTTPRGVRGSHVRLPSIRDLLNPIDSPAGTPSLSSTPTISAPSTSASPATPFPYSPNLATESNFTYSSLPHPYGRPNLISRHSVDTVQSSSSSYRPSFRRFRSDEGEMAGLGVLAAVSERVSQRSPPSRV